MDWMAKLKDGLRHSKPRYSKGEQFAEYLIPAHELHDILTRVKLPTRVLRNAHNEAPPLATILKLLPILYACELHVIDRPALDGQWLCVDGIYVEQGEKAAAVLRRLADYIAVASEIELVVDDNGRRLLRIWWD